jgi:hypothetical protein
MESRDAAVLSGKYPGLDLEVETMLKNTSTCCSGQKQRVYSTWFWSSHSGRCSSSDRAAAAARRQNRHYLQGPLHGAPAGGLRSRLCSDHQSLCR